MNFYRAVSSEKNFRKYSQKRRVLGYLPFLVRTMTKKIMIKNLDSICHKTVKFQKNLKHFKFWEFIYWKHGKATLKCIRNHLVLFVNMVKITLMNDEILV